MPRRIQAAESLLILVDIQDYFLDKLEPTLAAHVVARIGWLMQVAHWLDIPMLATAEEIDRHGGLSAQLQPHLPPGTPVLNKTHFGLAGQPDILSAVQDTGRTTAVLVGLETDVCVAQSALGLLDEGFRVAAIADATASPGPAHQFGIERMRDAGAAILSVKGLFYEWMGDVGREAQFWGENSEIVVPEGLEL
jgi:nicotinamidase-related amidase